MIHIDQVELMKAAAYFPPVRAKCTGCGGKGQLPAAKPDTSYTCPNCEGNGHTLREMDAREEHWYLMFLINNLDKRTAQ